MDETESWRRHYPFRSHELRIDGFRYHYLDEGAGPVLLMLHGNPTWSFYWRNLIQAWRGQYRVIVPDHLGCGLSDKPQDYPYRLCDHVGNVGRLLEHLDLREITLLAHDWGGAIGMGAATAAPERFARFVLFNTAAFRSRRIPLRIRICRTPLVGDIVVRGMNGFLRAALRMAVCHRERLTHDLRSGYLAPYGSWSHRIAIHRFVLDIPLGPRHPSYTTLKQIEDGLSQFRNHPVQLIWGMRDWCFTPHFLERFLDFFPQAEVHRIEDAGHWVIEDAHERIIPLIERFLEGTATTRSDLNSEAVRSRAGNG
ncbi:MAG: alpha/beta fold hydrolase [Planctomycetes bacterium]|nr:alpha/beta fold hydrolase [Planctomycetota bacterium]